LVPLKRQNALAGDRLKGSLLVLPADVERRRGKPKIKGLRICEKQDYLRSAGPS